jgi:protein involved in polysaccharide export with SLBB domain
VTTRPDDASVSVTTTEPIRCTVLSGPVQTPVIIPAGAMLTMVRVPRNTAGGLRSEWVEFDYEGRRYECHLFEFKAQLDL